MDKRDIKSIERDLAGAVLAFNVSRANLSTTLKGLNIRYASEDRLINFAEEFGVEHALKVLRETPEVLDFERGPSMAELARVKPQLSAAHDAQARADKLLAEKEGLLRETDPRRAKAILMAGRETLIDIERGIARDLETGREETLTVKHVETKDHRHSSEFGEEEEDERER